MCQAVEAPVGAKAARSGRVWSPGLATTWLINCNFRTRGYLPGRGVAPATTSRGARSATAALRVQVLQQASSEPLPGASNIHPGLP